MDTGNQGMYTCDTRLLTSDGTTGTEKKTSEIVLSRICRTAQQLFSSARGSHDWEHTLRVCRLCERIGPKEGADMLVLKAAALLHDIGRAAQDDANGSICHAVKGARIAAQIVEPMPLSISRKRNIAHCVRTHRFRGNQPPETIEAKVLFDADKIDAIGAVGVARAYLFAGELGACLHNPHIPVEKAEPYSKNDTGYREYIVKLSKIKTRIITSEGRRLAKKRHAFMSSFFKRFLQEYDGEC
jgi:uncharacterized protein